MVFLKILLITVVFMALAFAGFAVKMFFKKGGEFKKSCSSVHPVTGERMGCVCDNGGNCKNDEKDKFSKIKVQHVQLD